MPSSPDASLGNLNVEMLCSFGREIVSELQNRVSALVPAIKQDIEKNKSKNPVDVEQELSQIQELFNSLMEIRLRIDLLLLNDKECQGLSACDNEQTLDDKLFECFSESPQRTDQQADEKSRLAEEFELNRVKIVQFNARLRMVEWLATTTDFKIHPIIGKAGHESKN